MGRIVNTIEGEDGKVRVVTLKTTNGTLNRAVAKICTLPIHHDCSDDENPLTTIKKTRKRKSKKHNTLVTPRTALFLAFFALICGIFGENHILSEPLITNLTFNHSVGLYFESLQDVEPISHE